MKCNTCSTAMVLDRTEATHASRAEWYNCPLCGQVRMTASKISHAMHSAHISNTLANGVAVDRILKIGRAYPPLIGRRPSTGTFCYAPRRLALT